MPIVSNTSEPMAPARQTPAGQGLVGALKSLALADWLSLAAAPTFIAMAWLSALAEKTQMMCAAEVAFPLTGMAVMYLLMSAFHLTPWLRLLRRADVGDSKTETSALCRD
jgi:hypothetical protein